MTRPLRIGLALLAALSLTACDREAQRESSAGFAGLGEQAPAFNRAQPGTPLSIPEDHGSHPDFRIEWWYLTANLEDEQGESLGLQWTLFRQASIPPDERPEPGPWVADQLWMAHMAVSRGETHRVAERFARGLTASSAPSRQQAGVTLEPFRAWLDNWRLESRVTDPQRDPLSRLELEAMAEHNGEPFGYRLELIAEGPLVLHGEDGFSQKTADGQGSMYYSQPFYRIDGKVILDGETRSVTGRAWLDREWSSQMLEPWQTGWDWVSLHLADGRKLMAYRLRGGRDEGSGDYLFGNLIGPEGDSTSIDGTEMSLTPLETSHVAGRDMPTRWQLEVPVQGLDLVIQAPHANRWMATSVAYWEGEVIARDRESGERLGEGYLEMTGY
ncbi:lipocalin-like domain-containing protein [Halomonas daqiaonensis]|nr:lipocalin-like domain-containing protein [Halomonas daqiaonensis]